MIVMRHLRSYGKCSTSIAKTRLRDQAYTDRHTAADGGHPQMAGSVNPKQIQEPDFRLEGPARQGQLTADLVKTLTAKSGRSIAANPLSATTCLKVQLTLTNAGPRIRLFRSSRSTRPRTDPRAWLT